MRRGLIIGFAMWLVTMFVLRIWGGWLLDGDTGDFLVLLLVTGIIAYGVTALLLRYACSPGKAARFGAGLAIPGLFGYAGGLIAFCDFFPDLSSTMADLIGSLMMWWYAIVLVTALTVGDRLARN
ncbi:MAG: DUF5367 family protein [Hyphomicrobiales bacterium]